MHWAFSSSTPSVYLSTAYLEESRDLVRKQQLLFLVCRGAKFLITAGKFEMAC